MKLEGIQKVRPKVLVTSVAFVESATRKENANVYSRPVI